MKRIKNQEKSGENLKNQLLNSGEFSSGEKFKNQEIWQPWFKVCFPVIFDFFI